ncbi:MAG: hypothetical protein GY774_00290 [Planctomycetes bacterium]|nr:hypothetical protein [Planctomycetota bacterium]
MSSVSQWNVNGKWIDHTAFPAVNLGGVKFKIYRHPDKLVSGSVNVWHSQYKNRDEIAKRAADEYHPCYFYAKDLFELYMRGLNGENRNS